VTPFSLVDVYLHSRRTCYLHLQGKRALLILHLTGLRKILKTETLGIDNNVSQKYPLLETFSGGGCRFPICPYNDNGNDNNNTHLQELDLKKMPAVIQKFVNRIGKYIITINI
jgi:hypothetical protein